MNFAVDGSLACSGCPRAPGGTWEPCPGVAVVPPPPIPLHQDPGTWRPARELQNDANGPHPFDRTFDRTSRPSSRAPNPASRGVAPIRVATPTRHTRHAACQTRLAAGRCAPALGGRACAKRDSRDLEPWFGWSGSRLRGGQGTKPWPSPNPKPDLASPHPAMPLPPSAAARQCTPR